MADLATLQARLDEAEAAEHALMTGMKAVEVTGSTGSKVRYSETNFAELQRYIAKLKAAIASASGMRRGRAYRPGI